MVEAKKVVVVMPAYNAERTLEATFRQIPKSIVDEVILVDDCSRDGTVRLARKLGIRVFTHERNKGYGANQKTCYEEALRTKADIVVMLHPDYQYPPKIVTAMASLVASGIFDIVLGSRILGGYALAGGMPLYKYAANRLLTFLQNLLLGQKVSEYHTGYRAFSRQALVRLPLLENSDDFIFDNQLLVQAVYFGLRIGEVSAPSAYTRDSSSISFKRSVIYGFGVIIQSIKFLLQKYRIAKFAIFDENGSRLAQ